MVHDIRDVLIHNGHLSKKCLSKHLDEVLAIKYKDTVCQITRDSRKRPQFN